MLMMSDGRDKDIDSMLDSDVGISAKSSVLTTEKRTAIMLGCGEQGNPASTKEGL